jgi:hypothetical protein
MTDDDFAQWTAHLRIKFPEVGAWMSKQPKPEQQSRLQDWRDTLKYTTIDLAKAGLDAIYNDDLAMPRAFNRLPIVVRGYAMDNGPQRRDESEPVWNPETKQYSFKCLVCDDIGMITVCRADTQVMARDYPEKLTRKNFATCAVACNCDKGKRYSRRRKNAMAQYNDRTMCRITSDALTAEDKIAVLATWLGDSGRKKDISEHENFTDFEFT